ncbi:MAG: hypothetical protein ACYDHM_10475 [Acidiferrobacterales bacterium]
MTQQVNLYHPIFRRQQKKFSAMAMLQAGVTVLAGIALVYALSWWRIDVLRGQAREVDQQQAAAAKRITDIGRQFPLRMAAPVLAARLRRLQERVAASERAYRILRHEHFGSTVGYSGYLIAFAREHVPGLWLTGLSIGGTGRNMTLEGRSMRPDLVPRYLQRLSAEKLLAGTDFAVFRITRPQRPSGKGVLEPYVDFIIKTAVARNGAGSRS